MNNKIVKKVAIGAGAGVAAGFAAYKIREYLKIKKELQEIQKVEDKEFSVDRKYIKLPYHDEVAFTEEPVKRKYIKLPYVTKK